MKKHAFKVGDQVTIRSKHRYRGMSSGHIPVGTTAEVVDLCCFGGSGRFQPIDQPHVLLQWALPSVAVRKNWAEEAVLARVDEEPDIDQEVAALFGLQPSKQDVIDAIEKVDTDEGWNKITRRHAEQIATAILNLPWGTRRDT